jgi:hypothetical protein
MDFLFEFNYKSKFLFFLILFYLSSLHFGSALWFWVCHTVESFVNGMLSADV